MGTLDGVVGVRGVRGVRDVELRPAGVRTRRGVIGIFLDKASRCRGV